MPRLVYAGQCDAIRRGCPTGEAFWREMMATAQPITVSEFLRHVDPSPILDEDETFADFMADNPDASVFAATVAFRPVYFVATGGFEFIFATPGALQRRR